MMEKYIKKLKYSPPLESNCVSLTAYAIPFVFAHATSPVEHDDNHILSLLILVSHIFQICPLSLAETAQIWHKIIQPINY